MEEEKMNDAFGNAMGIIASWQRKIRRLEISGLVGGFQ